MASKDRRGATTASVLGAASLLLMSCGNDGAAGQSTGGGETATSDLRSGVTAEAVPTTFPTRGTAGDEAGCGDGAPHHAVCWFVKSLRAGDESGFNEIERDAAVSAGMLPEGDWFVQSCTTTGTSVYECYVSFGGTDVGHFEVVPANSTTDDDGSYVQPDQPADRYSVIQYRGSVPVSEE